MSFFGLTAFGPESIVKSSLVNSNGIAMLIKALPFFPMRNLQKDFIKLQMISYKLKT